MNNSKEQTFTSISRNLSCDITLGSSTKQFLEYHERNSSKETFIEVLKQALRYRAKTKPYLMARRLACLVGISIEVMKNPFITDVIIIAFNEAEKESKDK